MRTVCLAAFAALIFAGGPAFADDALSVILGVHTPPLMNTINLVAEGAGFYREEQLKVTTTLVDSPIEALRMCSRGQADICPAAIEPLIDHYGENLHLKLFLSRASKFGVVIAVPADSPIKVPTDLKGKAIGVHSATGSAGEFTTQSSLAASGLRPTDYTLVTIGMDKQALGALTSGQVQAVGLPLYELAPFMVEGLKLRIFRHPVIGDTPNGGYAAADAVMAAKSDQIGRFSRAIVKASLLIRYNPSAAARAMLTAQGKPFTDADQRRITAELTAWEDDLPASDPNSPTIGAISPEGMARYIKLLADSGVTRTVVPVSEVVTNQFIPYANAIDRKAFEARAEAMR